MRTIAILGFGTVGSGVAEALLTDAKQIEERLGEPIQIKYILDLREFPGHPLADRVVHDFNIVLNDPEVELVAEMMGGSHPAYDFSIACINAGKSVVTSNKEVVANYGAELLEAARQKGVQYMFEASVGGGIPVIRPMVNELTTHKVKSVNGILNGTTNFILTAMRDDGAAFADVLKEAQRMGFAEANPAADVEGLDAARKIVILAALAYGKMVSPKDISVEGITAITTADMEAAKVCGGSLKLIGKATDVDGKLLVMVSPCFVPSVNLLSHVDGVFNAIAVNTEVLGEVVYYGAGAGKLPTAAAVEADIVSILSGNKQFQNAITWEVADSTVLADAKAYQCRWFMSLGEKSFLTDAMTEAEACTVAEKNGAVAKYRVI